jgi:NTE family protein
MGHAADGVFQGGGVKGLGLVGALEAFADRDRHPDTYVDTWMSLAGTSAGAIVAAYLACGHSVPETVALVKGMPFQSFCDWGRGGEVIGGTLNLARIHGLAHGEVFHTWFRQQTAGRTFGEIEAEGRQLKMIATDLTRGEMLVLPQALADYRLPGGGGPIDPKTFAIADAVRMSMSIPYFFQPVELVHKTGATSTIVDGGVLSNFPVWIFDTATADPERPTFGFRLIGGRSPAAGLHSVIAALGWGAEMGAEIVHAATGAWDRYWVEHSSLVRTCAIDAGNISTTDFDLTPEQANGLLASGRAAGDAFLDSWKPEDYVNQHGRHLRTAVPA